MASASTSSFFDDSIFLGSRSRIDIDLFEWFSRNHERVMEYLSPGEAQQAKHHSCFFQAVAPPNCYYLSQHHHIRRSRHCPDVRDGLVTFPEDGVSEDDGVVDADIDTGGSDEWGIDLEGAGHDVAALDLWNSLPGDIMDLVYVGHATRKQSWVLEGILYRQMHAVTDGRRKEAFVKLWFFLYRARRGVQVHCGAFKLLEKFVDKVKELQCRGLPNATIEFLTSKDWVALLNLIGQLRELEWPNAADVLAGVRFSSARFADGSAIDEGDYCGDILRVLGIRPGRTDEIETLPYVMESIE
jgi:hypothetical protein